LSRKKIHRISVYLLDPDRRRVLLVKERDGKFLAPARTLSDTETPMQTVRNLVKDVVDVDLDFISHHTSAPMVIDGQSVRFGAPLFVQLTRVDDGHDHVDFVFLAQASSAPDLDGKSEVGWFNTEDLIGGVAPKNVKSTVRTILSLFND
jgi:hypothetical protein